MPTLSSQRSRRAGPCGRNKVTRPWFRARQESTERSERRRTAGSPTIPLTATRASPGIEDGRPSWPMSHRKFLIVGVSVLSFDEQWVAAATRHEETAVDRSARLRNTARGHASSRQPPYTTDRRKKPARSRSSARAIWIALASLMSAIAVVGSVMVLRHSRSQPLPSSPALPAARPTEWLRLGDRDLRTVTRCSWLRFSSKTRNESFLQ